MANARSVSAPGNFLGVDDGGGTVMIWLVDRNQ
jgi:hypothetical protein